jgi:hypothetical protein
MASLTGHTLAEPKLDKPQRRGQIVGKVVDDATGKPVAGALVACGAVVNETGGGGANAETDKEGVYRLAGLSPGIYNVWLKTYDKDPRLSAVADDGIVVEGDMPARSELRLVASRKVVGRVLDPDGKPVAGSSVGCYSAARPASGGTIMSVKTKAGGVFEFLLPPGSANLYVMSAGLGKGGRDLAASEVIEVPADKECPLVTLQLAPASREFGSADWLSRSTPGSLVVRREGNQDISGVVVDAAGKPVSKARVFEPDGPQTLTDDQGEFHLKTERGVQFILDVYAPGYHVWFGTPTSGDVLKIVLEPKVSAAR